MRLWSLHPSYLDCAGLVALWRESLLAKAVIEGKTRGYRNHPQLARFYAHEYPADAVNSYLSGVWREAVARGYSFDGTKFNSCECRRIPVASGQLEYELEHLKKKLRRRDPDRLMKLESAPNRRAKAHPLFVVVEGCVEDWEKL